jgi:hypothetical protein
LYSPALLSDQPSTFVADQSSGPAFELSLQLTLAAAFFGSAIRLVSGLRL